MSRHKVGDRVGAILKADGDQVHLLGYGVYDGEHEPPFGPFGLSKADYQTILDEMRAEGAISADYVWKNPRITLDDGRIVWGATCWWDSESAIRARIGNCEVVMATIEDVKL